MKADSKGIIKNIVAAKKVLDSETMEELLEELVAVSQAEALNKVIDSCTTNGVITVSPSTIITRINQLKQR